jgi:peptidoglycan/xylan/chitin deacetylase (PgdA/CDA1 family)
VLDCALRVIDFHLIFDFDAAIGQINATFPYNFDFKKIYLELDHVKYIAEVAAKHDLAFTFAVTGFTAEEGIYPYTAPDLIRDLHRGGHEIASHSWRHEWFPYLLPDQMRKSLRRSKLVLEQCIGAAGAVIGFVPPHNRPMSLARRGRFSLGDRPAGLPFLGNDISVLTRLLAAEGYRWARLSYAPTLVSRLLRRESDEMRRERVGDIERIPNMYTGFDAEAERVVERSMAANRPAIVSGHPSGLSRATNENQEHFDRFVARIVRWRDEGHLRVRRVSDALDVPR